MSALLSLLDTCSAAQIDEAVHRAFRRFRVSSPANPDAWLRGQNGGGVTRLIADGERVEAVSLFESIERDIGDSAAAAEIALLRKARPIHTATLQRSPRPLVPDGGDPDVRADASSQTGRAAALDRQRPTRGRRRRRTRLGRRAIGTVARLRSRKLHRERGPFGDRFGRRLDDDGRLAERARVS